MWRFWWHALLAVVFCSCARDPRLKRLPAGMGIDRAFAEAVGEAVAAPMTESNHVATLVNGEQAFPAILAAIQRATNTITFENFIWRSGALSDSFVEALCERAEAGVDVRIIVDAFGAIGFDERDRLRLEAAGVRLVLYNRLYKFWHWNHRTHRKLIVIDGGTGFIGGMCFADEWLGNAEAEPLWRDTHYEVQGPVVREFQEIIQTNWTQCTGETFDGRFFPPIAPAGDSIADCYCSGPGEGRTNTRYSFLSAISAAQKSIRLQHSYFVPDRLMIRALVDARRRGVHVEVMTPGVIHANVVRRASRSRWEPLIDAGVEFYEYQGTRMHCKLMIVDDAWVSVGSVNFDERSFRINDEANLQVLDPAFASTQIAMFENDKLRTLRVTKESYKRRGIWIRLLESFYGRFRSIL